MNKWTSFDSSGADGGFYHGLDHAYYGESACPTCGLWHRELVPIPRCESEDVGQFEQIEQVVYCRCGETYKAIYDWGNGQVDVFTPTDEQKQEKQRSFLDDHKN